LYWNIIFRVRFLLGFTLISFNTSFDPIIILVNVMAPLAYYPILLDLAQIWKDVILLLVEVNQLLHFRFWFTFWIWSFEEFIDIIVIQIILEENHMWSVDIDYHFVCRFWKVKIKSFKVFSVDYIHLNLFHWFLFVVLIEKCCRWD